VAKRAAEVFLNIPYDAKFEDLFLAYITGIVALGFVPRATLEIPGGDRRLEKIFDLIGECRYSIHDLSRVQLDRRPPRVPRFNMPFELGLTVARHWKAKSDRHVWFVCESMEHRLLKSLSDLNGTDPCVHGGTAPGVLRELLNMFKVPGPKPSLSAMLKGYKELRRRKSALLADAGPQRLYTKQAFESLCLAAQTAIEHPVR
jgi:hypothetical protein